MLTDYPWQLWLILYPVPDFGFFCMHQESAMTKKVENFAKKRENSRQKAKKSFPRHLLQMAPKFSLNVLFCSAVLKYFSNAKKYLVQYQLVSVVLLVYLYV